jgi:FkbH-like protein
MKLLEALEIIRSPLNGDAPRYEVFLACAFTPVYLKTYIHAHLRSRLPGHVIEIKSGTYGDLPGPLEKLAAGELSPNAHACVVFVEWPDVDERLGFRTAGGWRAAGLADVQETVRLSLERLAHAVRRVQERMPVVISTPSLPLAPISYVRPDEGDVFYWRLEAAIASWALGISQLGNVTVLNRRWLDSAYPPAERADYRSDLATGFPYHLGFTDVLADSIASFVVPGSRAKALITDLDDTLWMGILGETGVNGVQWSLEYNAQPHALYQQFLRSLVDSGVLVGVASKNDPALVEQVLDQRKDLLIEGSALFPREVNWGPKSLSVGRILQAWNISADAAVFVDDSPMEVAEVMAAYPQIQGIVFPKDDPAALAQMLTRLRRAFGTKSISDEDRLRAASLRPPLAGSEFASHEAGSAPEGFLRAAQAVVRIDCTIPPKDGRALELVNKTNQFNLNGVRYSEGEWQAVLRRPGALVMVLSYEDRFGPLGRISVLTGQMEGDTLNVSSWVLSCRAFSRRVESACLRFLFNEIGVKAVRFEYLQTPRNGPVQEFLRELLGETPTPGCILDSGVFLEKCPPLYHAVHVDAGLTSGVAG